MTSHETNLVFALSIDAIPLLQEPIYLGFKERHFLLLLLFFPFSFKLVKINFLLRVLNILGMLLLQCLLNMYQVLLKVKK